MTKQKRAKKAPSFHVIKIEGAIAHTFQVAAEQAGLDLETLLRAAVGLALAMAIETAKSVVAARAGK